MRLQEEVSVIDREAERRKYWNQTPETRLTDVAAAAAFIERVGMATVYPVSPEVPNLYHAYMGDPDAPTDSRHDSPSGLVYTWRWDLGNRSAGFYGAIVRRRPTWVSWGLLPAVLRLVGDTRTPDELYDLGAISAHAYRIAQALEEAGGALSTRDLRDAARFPTGKEQRAAYLKAVDELDTRLLLAKVFSTDGEMGHALVSVRHPDALEAAGRMTRGDAIDRVLLTYLPSAVYIVPPILAKHLGITVDELSDGLERLVARERVRALASTSARDPSHIWIMEGEIVR